MLPSFSTLRSAVALTGIACDMDRITEPAPGVEDQRGAILIDFVDGGTDTTKVHCPED